LSVRICHNFQKIQSILLQKVRTSAFEEPHFPKNVRTGKGVGRKNSSWGPTKKDRKIAKKRPKMALLSLF